jgi:hypothetical protein
MNKYMDDFMDCNSKMYKKIVEKLLNNEELTDNEFLLMLRYETNVKKISKVSPIKKIINAIKEVGSFMSDEEDNVDGI